MAPTFATRWTVESLVRLAASPPAFAEIAPGLEVSDAIPSIRPGRPRPTSLSHRAGANQPDHDWLAREGFSVLTDAAPREACAALAEAVEALHACELPAVFLYAFDQPWRLGERVRRRISAAAGREYRLVEDVWAWRVAPGGGGWPPHRGIDEARLERDAPEILNVWLALGDVAADQACMHAIPLDEDPGYPDALATVEAPLASVRALPARAGDALVWNANVLHWGGRSAPRAAGPRVSCSFTLCRADAVDRFAVPLMTTLDMLDLAGRMDVVARMVTLYGGDDRGDVATVVRQWANLTHGLAARFRGERTAPREPS